MVVGPEHEHRLPSQRLCSGIDEAQEQRVSAGAPGPCKDDAVISTRRAGLARQLSSLLAEQRGLEPAVVGVGVRVGVVGQDLGQQTGGPCAERQAVVESKRSKSERERRVREMERGREGEGEGGREWRRGSGEERQTRVEEDMECGFDGVFSGCV